MTYRARPSFQIRDASPADRAAIVDFNCRLALETEGKVLDPRVIHSGVARALEEPDRLRYWVAELDQPDRLVVGQTAITREWSDWRNGWIWWLQSVYVHPDFRGQGIFKSLYRHVRDQAARADDVIGVRLYVEDSNLQARKTYLSLGMKPGGYSVLEALWVQ